MEQVNRALNYVTTVLSAEISFAQWASCPSPHDAEMQAFDIKRRSLKILDTLMKCLRYNHSHEISSDNAPSVAVRYAAHQWAGSQWHDWAVSDARGHGRR
jgi:hypothetical protein